MRWPCRVWPVGGEAGTMAAMVASTPRLLRIAHAQVICGANGPGERYTVWVQGCSRRCPGCFNPGLQTGRGGVELSAETLAARACRGGVPRGISLSGGEPFEQAPGLAAFLEAVAERSRVPPDVIAFTGYVRGELEADPARFGPLLERVDLLVDGPYRSETGPGGPLRGSANQGLHALSAAGRQLLERVGGAGGLGFQVVVSPAGEVIVTGFPPPGVAESLLRKLGG